MTATSFDVPVFHRRSDVVTVLLSTIELREAAVAEREADLARRERALEVEERINELKQLSGQSPAPAADGMVRTRQAAAPARLRFHDTFKLRELEWWSKQLGSAPALT